MKKVIKNYTFSASTKKITFTDYSSISLEGVMLITNAMSNVIIYNFADPLLGGLVSGNVLTLDYNTGAMSNTDKLQIFYDDPDSNLDDAAAAILEAARQITFLANAKGLSGEIRTSILSGIITTVNTVTTVSTVTTVGTVTTVSTVANQSNIGGLSAQQIVPATQNQAALASNITNVILT